ncbi:hypothetical protein SUGI_0153990 [Cryptomeria japonica]|nr:hypothetical protein SUGI_0153990 [Cryptomeria japonica]
MTLPFCRKKQLYADSSGLGHPKKKSKYELRRNGALMSFLNSCRSNSSLLFSDGVDKQRVVNGGLWKMKGAPLYIQQWYENFDPSKLHPLSHPFWIRLYNLPQEYWAEDCLVKIG